MTDRRTGTEPRTARSPLRLRLVLSAVVLPLALLATIYFGAAALRTGETVWTIEAVLTGLIAIVAAIDIVVLIRRLRRSRRP